MSRLLFGIIFFAVTIYLLNRFLTLISSSLRPKVRSDRQPGKGMDLVQDAYCLTYLPRENALETRKNGSTHYFCSQACAQAFEQAAPKHT